jgi:LemA protein
MKVLFSLRKLAKSQIMRGYAIIASAGVMTLLSGCGIRSIPLSRNQVDAAQAEVVNQYKRRADLVPNLVNVVKGYADHEQETLTKVVEARAKATSIQVTIDDAESMKKYQEAQQGLSQALGKLLAVSENYPNLKANENFRDLQAQLEGTENRITVARSRTIESIQTFNNLITVFPTNLTNMAVFHHKPLPQYGEGLDIKQLEQAPDVKF